VPAAFVGLEALWLPSLIKLKKKAAVDGDTTRWWQRFILLLLLAPLLATTAFLLGLGIRRLWTGT